MILMKKSAEKLSTMPLNKRLIISNFRYLNKSLKNPLDFNKKQNQHVDGIVEHCISW